MSCEPYLNWRGVPTSFSSPVTFLPTSFSGCSYLVLQAKYDVFDKPGYARILLSIYANKSRRSYDKLLNPYIGGTVIRGNR